MRRGFPSHPGCGIVRENPPDRGGAMRRGTAEMGGPRKRPAVGAALASMAAACVGFYFTFAAVQGNFGVFRRVQATAEKETLLAEHARLAAEVARMENLTRRLSDTYLDLDLLDERARNVLGLVRADEIVVH